MQAGRARVSRRSVAANVSSSSSSSTSTGAASEDVFTSLSSLYGPVRKAGPLDEAAWLKPHAVSRHKRYWKYLRKWEREHPFGMPPSSGLPDPPPVIFPECQVRRREGCGILLYKRSEHDLGRT